MSSRNKELLTNLTLIVAIFVVSLVPLIGMPRFYFLDDTQRGALGQWYEIGRLVLNGHLPIMSVAAQGAGNHIAEGQWGTFSPFVWLVSIAIYLSKNYVVTVTSIKILTLIVFGLGFRKLAQSFGVSDGFAFVGGLTVPFMGFITYAGAATWVTDLFVAAFMPVFWWLLRRFLYQNKSAVWPLIVGFTIISIGYVYGTMFIVVIMLGSIIGAAFKKNWQNVKRIVLLGIPLGLTTIAVYWPGMQISGVTMRSSSLANNQFLSPNVGQLVTSFLPTAYPDAVSYYSGGNGITYLPLMYISWILLALSFVDYKNAFKRGFSKLSGLKNYTELSVAVFASFLLLFGPSVIGPLRYMIRTMAYFGQFSLLLALMFLTIASSYIVINKRTLIQSLVVVGLGTYLAWAKTPERVGSIFAVGLGIWLAVAILILLVNHQNVKFGRLIATGIVLFLTLGISYVQHRNDVTGIVDSTGAHKQTTFTDFGMPATKSAVEAKAKLYRGDTVVFGSNTNAIIGNDWYIAGVPSINVYTPVGFKAYADDFRGADPTFIDPKMYTKLFSKDSTTKLTLADLYSIDTVQFFKEDPADSTYTSVVKDHNLPTGWMLTDSNDDMFIIQRKQKTGNAGGVVWSNHEVTQVKNGQYTVKVRVPANTDTTKFVLSRLDWPGYTISSNAKIIKPLRGYLLQVSVKPGDTTRTVTIKFHAPGFKLSQILLLLAGIEITIWGLVTVVWNRKKAKAEVQA